MTRDQFLCELMKIDDEGYWWCPSCLMRKSPVQVTYGERCTYCCNSVEWNAAPNFSEWPDKGRLLDFVMAQEWWGEFSDFVVGRCFSLSIRDYFKYLIDNLPDLVYEYKGGKK